MHCRLWDFAKNVRSLFGLVVVIFMFQGAALPALAIDLTSSGTQWAPYLEWSLDNPTFADNPYDLIASATFVHQGTGITHTTEMFYDSGTTWKFRFTGTKLGIWTVSTSSSDSDLDGHTGTVTITSNANPNIRGFVTHVGNQWTHQLSENGASGVFVPQLVMANGPQGYFQNPTAVDDDIATFLVQHGFTGFHTNVKCRWFNLNEKVCANIVGDPSPDPQTFEALELLITKVHQAGGMVHIWAWGDEARGETPTVWGLNGLVDQRIQRYLAARLGPLQGWTMGYGFDNFEWTTELDLMTWHDFMHQHLGWPHLLGARASKNILDQLYEGLDYSGYEQHKPDYDKYVETIEARPTKPSFSEDRFRMREPSQGKDYTMVDIRRGLWHSTMAGGVANIWGNLLGEGAPANDGEATSAPFPNPEWIETNSRFFANRLELGMVRCNTLTDGVCLQSADGQRKLFYKEGASSISLNLSGLSIGQPAVAVDTLAPYVEIDLGLLNPSNQTWNAPYPSDWSIAVGSFAGVPIAIDDSYSANQGVALIIPAPGVVGNDFDPNGETLMAVINSNPNNGTVILNADGSFTYSPNGGFSGTDNLTYHAHDGDLESNVATVTLSVNGAPVANDDAGTTVENVGVDLAVLTNDTDEGALNPASVTVTSGPTSGSTSVDSGSGEITYVPNAGFFGTDSFGYTVMDAQGLESNEATVTVTVTMNEAPVANDDSVTTEENVGVVIAVLANDTDDGGLNASSVVVQNGPSHGMATADPGTGDITYTPNLGFSGSDSFTYMVEDTQGALSNVAIVTVNVGSLRVQSGLVVYYPLSEGSGTTVQDQSGTGTPMNLALSGTVSWATDGNGLVFTDGQAQTSGAATKVIQALQTTNTSTMEVWVQSTNITQSGPARVVSIGGDASSQNYVLGQNGDDLQVRYLHTGKDSQAKPRLETTNNVVTTGLLHIVHTYDGSTERVYVNGVENPITVSISGVLTNWDATDPITLGNEGSGDRPWAGTMRMMAMYDRALTQSEVQQNFDAGAFGPGSGPTNFAPLAQADNYSTPVDTVLSINAPGVLGNDSDSNGDPLTATLDTNASNGTVSLNANGSFTYTPNGGFIGADSFTYHAYDGELNSNVVTVNVSVDSGFSLAIPQTLNPADGVVGVAISPTLEISCNDSDVAAAQYMMATDSGFANVVYDSLETVNDLCSHIALAQLDPLTQYHWRARVLDDQGDWSNWSSGSSFTTNNVTALFFNVFQDDVANYSGTADVDIRGSGTNPTNVIRNWDQGGQDVLRTGRRIPGSSTDEIYRTLVQFDISALTNANSVVNAYIEFTGWQHGPAADNIEFLAPNSMYEVVRRWGEGNGITDSAPTNGESSWLSSFHPELWSTPGAANASDTNSNADRKASPLVKLVATNQVGYKTLWSSKAFVDAVKNWIANPNENHGVLLKADDEGIKKMLFLGSKEHSDSSFHPRLVIVSSEQAFPSQNQAPVAIRDMVYTGIGTQINIPVLENDQDQDGNPSPLSIVNVNTPQHGTANIVGNEVRYQPNQGYEGIDQFLYSISDGSDTATAFITVEVGNLNANSAPVANSDTYNGTQDTVLNQPAPGVLTNDSDPNGDPITAVLDTNASNGTVVFNADGSFTYTPTAGFSGTDSFTYHTHDGVLDSSIVTVTLILNGAPVSADDTATTVQNVAVSIAVLANDTDDHGLNAASVVVQSGPSNGTANVDIGTGTIIYTPTTGFLGTDSLTYSVQDLAGLVSNVATVTVTVNNALQRVEAGLVVYYPLSTGSGTTVHDQSNVGTAMDLTLSGNVTWATEGPGLVFTGGQAQSGGAATKVIDAMQATNQSTMEVWVEPANISQSGPTRVVSIGGDASFQNYVLGQQGDDVQVRYLHSGKDSQAKPRLETNDNSVTIGLLHLVHTYDGTTERLYVNGVENLTTILSSGVLSNWDATDPLTLGNEGSGDRPWAGTMRMMAMYDRALTPTEVQQNFAAGSTATSGGSTNQAPVATNDNYNGTPDTVLNVNAPGVLGNDTDGNNDPLTAVLDANPSNGTVSL
ncbi:MAG: Ig-like domain-containing protein, partial [Nitrospirae bacterium]|nr:Ig-like domain-containing protein [Nitrospirota bacterium]MDA1305181.1 Ig-like domain-containing protein [Nitrospirota bacterium]